jgi:hypothetical protein
MMHALNLYLPCGQSSIFFGALSQCVERTTPTGSHLARLAFHEEHRHIFTTAFAVSRAVDGAPPLVVAIAVVKLRLSNAHRSYSSGSVSIFILRGSWRAWNDGGESID